ncbi:MAG: 16S rRNA (guanine(527)-N(7))-methyltransferase RsmG [Actinobacteria bacterium HGW-Actinobacteria-10]|jgi:16S rRNA (guanine527-N7)-methyltransferase|nr:MAG: 16S rRNA (guanine(527)-N(7))-methyltransferase RsmG [Actinobacteria bacterium HGW-Actinobacteria-10]
MFHVKPTNPIDSQYSDLLCNQADLVGVGVDAESCSLLLEHLKLVLHANMSFNLTTITDSTEAIRLHVVDSLVGVPEVITAPAGRLADIGSGAGYPGIPVAIVCRRRTTLFESVGKKARFLEETVGALDLADRIDVQGRRSEELSETHRGAYAVVTARALSSLPSLLELSSPLLAVGGELIAYKAGVDVDERLRGESAAALLGFELRRERRIFLPTGGEERTILVYAKVGEPTMSLPRRPGLAQRRPLA